MKLNIKHKVTFETRGLLAPNARILKGGHAHAPPSPHRHILHSLDGTQLIDTCILFYSRAEVQRFMTPKFLKQRFMILSCFVTMIHDSASTPEGEV